MIPLILKNTFFPASGNSKKGSPCPEAPAPQGHSTEAQRDRPVTSLPTLRTGTEFSHSHSLTQFSRISVIQSPSSLEGRKGN